MICDVLLEIILYFTKFKLYCMYNVSQSIYYFPALILLPNLFPTLPLAYKTPIFHVAHHQKQAVTKPKYTEYGKVESARFIICYISFAHEFRFAITCNNESTANNDEHKSIA